jgi:uncharacterized protein YerC
MNEPNLPTNHYSSRKEWEDVYWEKLIKQPKILKSFITNYERHILVLRIAVVARLNNGKSYREISKELWLSPQTISSIKKAINKKGYESYRKIEKTERKPKVFNSSTQKKKKFRGRSKRTKYGTIYLK